MSEYTDEQAAAFYEALEGRSDANAAVWGKRWLQHMTDAGITVQFPEPRYYVDHVAETGEYRVRERVRSNVWLARFASADLAWNRRMAEECADRLNREAQS